MSWGGPTRKLSRRERGQRQWGEFECEKQKDLQGSMISGEGGGNEFRRNRKANCRTLPLR